MKCSCKCCCKWCCNVSMWCCIILCLLLSLLWWLYPVAFFVVWRGYLVEFVKFTKTHMSPSSPLVSSSTWWNFLAWGYTFNFFNLYCMYEGHAGTGNNLVCVVDVRKFYSYSAADYEKQHGYTFCGKLRPLAKSSHWISFSVCKQNWYLQAHGR